MNKPKHLCLSEEEILKKIKAVGHIGRHKYKYSNRNILKKLRKLHREGKISILSNSSKFITYGPKRGGA